MLMTIFATLLDFLPFTRPLYTLLFERKLEIEVLPANWLAGRDEEPSFNLAIENPQESGRGSLFMHCGLVLTNHRIDRLERIIRGWVVLKSRRLGFWRKTHKQFPVCHRVWMSGESKELPLENIELPPLSPPIEYNMWVYGNLTLEESNALPNRIEAWMEFDLVGPVRHKKKHIHSWKRNFAPKAKAVVR